MKKETSVVAVAAILILVNIVAAILEDKSTSQSNQQAVPSIDAYDVIEAENFDSSYSSIDARVYTVDNFTFVGNLHDGSYIRYDDVDFADGAVGVTIKIFANDVQPGTLIQIDFQLSVRTGPVFHTINVGPTHGNDISVTEYFVDNRPAGTWIVYLTIRDAYGRCCPLNIDWFQFFQ